MKVLQSQKKFISKRNKDLEQKKMKQDVSGDGSDHGVENLSKKSTFGQCMFNMANILMGVGMLGLPFLFKRAGWFGGLFVTILFSFVGKYCLQTHVRTTPFYYSSY